MFPSFFHFSFLAIYSLRNLVKTSQRSSVYVHQPNKCLINKIEILAWNMYCRMNRFPIESELSSFHYTNIQIFIYVVVFSFLIFSKLWNMKFHANIDSHFYCRNFARVKLIKMYKNVLFSLSVFCVGNRQILWYFVLDAKLP